MLDLPFNAIYVTSGFLHAIITSFYFKTAKITDLNYWRGGGNQWRKVVATIWLIHINTHFTIYRPTLFFILILLSKASYVIRFLNTFRIH
jgi:hypothetical protein